MISLSVAHGSFAEFHRIWQDGQLCDVVLQPASGKGIPAHKLVLCAVSSYFRGLLLGAGRHMLTNSANLTSHETASVRMQIVDLPALDAKPLMCVLQAVYTQQLEVDMHSVQQILGCSDFLGIPTVKDACCEYLARHLDVANCLTILQLASVYSDTLLTQRAVACCCAHFTGAMAAAEAAEQLAALPKQTVMQLLGHETLTATNELDVAQAAVSWLCAHPDTLQHDVAHLLSTVRLPPGQLRCEIESGEIRVDSSQCRSAIMAQLRGDAASQMLPAPQPRFKLPVMLVAAGGHDPSWLPARSTEIYRPQEDAWAAGPLLPQGFSFATGAVTARGDAYVVGGATHCCSIAKLYDAADSAWRQCDANLTPRLHAAVAACRDHLYILGGRAGATSELRSTEVLSPGSARRWQRGPDMHCRRTALAAATIQDQLYVVGGQSGRQVHATAERLVAARGHFMLLGSTMSCERKYTAAAALDGRVYVVGGMDAQRKRLSSVEALDPREGKWRTLPAMCKPRASCGVAELQGELFVVAGSGGNDTILPTVEAFSPAAGAWRPIAPLSIARSNLALLALAS